METPEKRQPLWKTIVLLVTGVAIGFLAKDWINERPDTDSAKEKSGISATLKNWIDSIRNITIVFPYDDEKAEGIIQKGAMKFRLSSISVESSPQADKETVSLPSGAISQPQDVAEKQPPKPAEPPFDYAKLKNDILKKAISGGEENLTSLADQFPYVSFSKYTPKAQNYLMKKRITDQDFQNPAYDLPWLEKSLTEVGTLLKQGKIDSKTGYQITRHLVRSYLQANEDKPRDFKEIQEIFDATLRSPLLETWAPLVDQHGDLKKLKNKDVSGWFRGTACAMFTGMKYRKQNPDINGMSEIFPIAIQSYQYRRINFSETQLLLNWALREYCIYNGNIPDGKGSLLPFKESPVKTETPLATVQPNGKAEPRHR